MRFHYLPLAVIIGALSGCATDTPPEPKVALHESALPTIAKCEPIAKRPTFPDTDAALKVAPDDRFVQLLQAGRLMRSAYIGELEAAVTGCGGLIE